MDMNRGFTGRRDPKTKEVTIVDKNDKAKNDKLTMKKKADKNNPKLKKPFIAGVSEPEQSHGKKPKKTYE